MKKGSILLHSCCAICSAYPIVLLRELGYEPVSYFFNPNIQPEEEYYRRLDAQRTLCEKLECELLVGDYDGELFERVSLGLEREPEKGKRCINCFELRLEHSAKMAKELGIANFTTTIVISPHKNFSLISNLGMKISKKYDINYLDIDFKKKDGFLKTNKIAREFGLYRQSYCGCLYGKEQDLTNEVKDGLQTK